MAKRSVRKVAEQTSPVAVVTGGRQGIGLACGEALAKSGFDIVVVDLVQDDQARAAVEALRGLGRNAKFVKGDIAAVGRLDSLADRIFSAFGRVDCLLNNAGVLPKARGRDLLDVTPETFDLVMNVNLRGTFFFTQAMARRMIAVLGGEHHRSIVTITSGAVGTARLDTPEYAFSKTCLSLMSQAFAARLGEYGIHTYEVRPGVIKTEMSRDVWPMYETMIEQGRFPIPRMGLPEDVAETVVALARGLVPYSSGDFFAIDGGFHVPAAGIAPRKPAAKR
jgi:NAD(P)-dependent dehydrogenase (short-subunit alcohol dehydrogenase family)